MQCPTCQSPNVQLCSVAYDQGTSTTTTKTTGTAYSRGTATGTGVAVGGAMYSGQQSINETHTSVQRTAFAERAGPPVNPIVAPLKVLVGLIVFLGAIDIINAVFPDIVGYFLGTRARGGFGIEGLEHLTWWIIAAAVAWLIFGITKLPSHRANKARWRKSWICAACGNTFVPGA
jgi:hypothetical protein